MDRRLNNPPQISYDELQGMRDTANHFTKHGDKSERRIAHKLAKAVRHIEHGIYVYERNHGHECYHCKGRDPGVCSLNSDNWYRPDAATAESDAGHV